VNNEQTALEKRGGFSSPAPRPVSAAGNTDAERAIAEVKGAITIAMANPRDQAAAVERIRAACRRPSLAESAIYAYPRGGATVTGPSIRLAEALAQNWGNFQFGVRELSNDGAKSTIQAYAWDVETNTRSEKTFEVPHTRYSRDKGNVRLTDPRDIYEMVANQGARRLRACILSAIPGDVVEMAVTECGKTQEAEASKDGRPLSERIKAMLAAFAKVGVDRQALESYLKHKLEDCSAAELISTGRILTSINDGVATAAQYFAPKAKPAASVKDSVAEKAAQARGGGIAGIFGGKKQPGKLDPESGEREPDPEEDDEQFPLV
jgi:hypothetical protein